MKFWVPHVKSTMCNYYHSTNSHKLCPYMFKIRTHLSSVHNRYPAMYAGCQNLFKCCILLPKHSFFLAVKCIWLTICFNNKTIPAQSCGKSSHFFKPTRPRPCRLIKYQGMFCANSQEKIHDWLATYCRLDPSSTASLATYQAILQEILQSDNC